MGKLSRRAGEENDLEETGVGNDGLRREEKEGMEGTGGRELACSKNIAGCTISTGDCLSVHTG